MAFVFSASNGYLAFMTNLTHAQERKQPLPTLALAAIGIVFGDIGTSPLYALKEAFSPSHGIALSDASILGVISLLFWAVSQRSLRHFDAACFPDHGHADLAWILQLGFDLSGNGSRQGKSLFVIDGLRLNEYPQLSSSLQRETFFHARKACADAFQILHAFEIRGQAFGARPVSRCHAHTAS